MDFNKMKLGKKGSSSVGQAMSELMTAVILIAVFSLIVITIITIFAPLVQTKAEEAHATAVANNNTAVAGLWSILATEGMFEILAVAVYVLVIVFTLIGLITKATKSMK